ncbi:hypothetical protein N2152v2_005395 [Parachlorella kessleri]
MVTAIRSQDTRLAALQQVAELTAVSGAEAAVTAIVLAEAGVVGAAAQALETSDPLTQDELEAVLGLATNLAQLPDRAYRQALAGSGLVAALLGLLSFTHDAAAGAAVAPATTTAAASGAVFTARGKDGGSRQKSAARPRRAVELPPSAQLEVVRCLRLMARQGAVRDELQHDQAGLGAVINTLDAAVQSGDFALAGEAAWVLEMLGVSRRLCSRIGELGGVQAVLSLLIAALASRPAIRELPRSEEANKAASSAVHALSVLLTDSRANRTRLRAAAGAVPALADVLGDAQLDWESKEEAAALLEDLAATLLLDERPLPESPHYEEWRVTTVPKLVKILQQYRGLPHMQQTKEAIATILEKLAASCEECSLLVRQAGAVGPLVQLLAIGSQMAGGERRLCCVSARVLQELAPANKDALAQASAPCAGRQLSLLDLLARLAEEGAEGDPLQLAPRWQQQGSAVQAGWLAAAVVARLCQGHPRNQEEAIARGLLRTLCSYLQAPLGLPGAPGAVGEGVRDALLRIKCEVAEALRSISMRATHHPALRTAGVPQHAQHILASTVPTWTELRAAAKRILQNLGQLPDLDRPLMTYSADQLAALLQSQGVEPQRFRQRGIGGAEFVRLSDADIRELVLAAQTPRVLRMLRAYESFDEVDCAGTRDGCLTLAKLVAFLAGRGFRQDEIIPLAESLMQLMDGDRDDLVAFPDFLQCYEEFRARVMLDVQPPSKKRKTSVAS